MADTNDKPTRRRPARALAEKSWQAERQGDEQTAQDLLAEADRIRPDETIEVLQEQAAASVSEEPEWEPADPGRFRDPGAERGKTS